MKLFAIALSTLVSSCSALQAASLLGNVGRTTVAGTVSTGVATPYTLQPGEDIFGPFEAGFSSQQDFILEGLGCSTGSLGHVAGGIDTHTAEQMVSHQCGVELPRFEGGIRISLLDDCGGHTQAYHFHERLRCLYDDVGTHSAKVGEANDGRGIYGKYENSETGELPELDACGGHWGFTPDSPDQMVYHYHVQDHAPFTVGCFGPNPDNSLVTVEQCRDLYPGCNGDSVPVTTPLGTVEYELWCPCYDANGSNHGVAPLPVFSTPAAAGPGTDYVEPESASDLTDVPTDAKFGATTEKFGAAQGNTFDKATTDTKFNGVKFGETAGEAQGNKFNGATKFGAQQDSQPQMDKFRSKFGGRARFGRQGR